MHANGMILVFKMLAFSFKMVETSKEFHFHCSICLHGLHCIERKDCNSYLKAIGNDFILPQKSR